MGTPTQERLGKLIRGRRESRGIYTVNEAARQSGISRDTWAKIENGEPAKPVTYRKIEDTLLWAHGSCGAVLAGGDPTPLLESAESDRDEIDRALDIMRAAIAELERIKRGRNAS